ncbi:Flp family type IVb pilin [Bacillus sp. PS06]|uniref:Flp family type IVb pilin n=1 Tax=Bacillus sp. PS06 TaxID=2764176 RepID=UPI001783105C|nr:Flp family type IVb pilin [Bacillus sp. PS06]MBD8069121.1 Flp family type IVb pilin [Bacillus sp. PS06]
MKKQIKRFIKDEKGQGMTEYGLILGVVALGAIGAFWAFGDTLTTKVGEVTTNITNGFTKP